MISDEELQRLIGEVPDTDDTMQINYWKRVNDEVIYLEGGVINAWSAQDSHRWKEGIRRRS